MLRKLSYALLWAFAFTVPWQNVVLLQSLGTISRAVGLLAAVVGALTILLEGRRHRLVDVHLFTGAYATWVAISLFWSSSPAGSRISAFTTVQLLAMVILVWEFGREPAAQRGLLWAYVLGALVSCGATFWDFIEEGLDGTRFAAPGFNENGLGLVLSLGIPIAWYLVVTARGRSGLLARLYVLLAVPAVVLTGSRGSLITALVAMSLLPLTFRHMPGRARLLTVLQLAAVVALVLAIVPEETLERLGETQTEITSGELSTRGALWDSATGLIAEHPWVGVGAGQSPGQIMELNGLRNGAHNTYLAIAADVGIVGLTLFLLVVVAVIARSFGLRSPDRVFVPVLLLTLLVGLFPVSLQYNKVIWLVIALAANQQSTRLARDPVPVHLLP